MEKTKKKKLTIGIQEYELLLLSQKAKENGYSLSKMAGFLIKENINNIKRDVKDSRKNKNLTMYLEDEKKKLLEKKAQKENLTLGELIRKIIRENC